MKIYTKTGDKGTTSLIGGTRVSKSHPRIEAYGTIDELNAFIGLVRDLDNNEKRKDFLFQIQNCLFVAESLLACDNCEMSKLPKLTQNNIEDLENEIDCMNATLIELTHFIIPGGHPLVSYSHIARTVCRRAERISIKLSLDTEIDNMVLIYLNRLSDFLFVLARKYAQEFKIPENSWKHQ